MTAKKQQEETTAYGVASIICATLSLFILWIVFAPLSIVFGGIGISKGSKVDKTISIVGLVFGIAVTLFVVMTLMVATTYRR